MKLDPTIVIYGPSWRELDRAPLSQIGGMAYGVREDFERGVQRLTGNQCPNDTVVRGVALPTQAIAWDVVPT